MAGLRYLLILGNDDAVPYFHVENPLGSRRRPCSSWQLPTDWLPSDNFYTDLDGDPYDVPDLPVARIPSSDDADLLLTQLGETVAARRRRLRAREPGATEPGRRCGHRRSIPGMQVGPPTARRVDAERFNERRRERPYLYVLLHGIGVLTDAWSANTVVWDATPDKPLTTSGWSTSANQLDAVTSETTRAAGASSRSGPATARGPWTPCRARPQDRRQQPRAALPQVAARGRSSPTRTSRTASDAAANTPTGRTGFESVFWKGIDRRHDADRRLPGGQGRRSARRSTSSSTAGNRSTQRRSTSRPSTTWSTWGAHEPLPDPDRRLGRAPRRRLRRRVRPRRARRHLGATSWRRRCTRPHRSPRRQPRRPRPRSCASSTRRSPGSRRSSTNDRLRHRPLGGRVRRHRATPRRPADLDRRRHGLGRGHHVPVTSLTRISPCNGE